MQYVGLAENTEKGTLVLDGANKIDVIDKKWRFHMGQALAYSARSCVQPSDTSPLVLYGDDPFPLAPSGWLLEDNLGCR